MKVEIPELQTEHRLGRHINHDPRSLRYLAEPATVDRSAAWVRHVPVFDQGNIGSCTGNALAGALASTPFYETMPENLSIDQALAVKLYSAATKLDPYGGVYLPTDTGSDGLSVNKAAQDMGFIAGYIWATSIERAQTMIQQGPFIIGTQWTSALDKPDANGFVPLPMSGKVRGGHEYMCFARDAENDRWWFYNSWGPTWGKNGTFCYNSAGLLALMHSGGDITQSVAMTQPPPEPTPPEPPTPVVDANATKWWLATKPWATGITFALTSKAGKAARASIEFAKQLGL